MRKVLILLSIASLIAMTACREDKQGDTLKVGINYNKSTNNQKINVIRDATGAYINWNGSDKIALFDATDGSPEATATFKNSSDDNTAIFTLTEGTDLDDGNYAVYYPSTAIPGNTFSTPDYYLIDPTDLNDYLNDKLLMYTQTPYRHGTDEKIQLT
ncbi:MAG: hypothetical protein GX330_07425, partial [Bacteroidales bacterium]|nr:hypothetical protein [Bacteroidales bacterium]